ncbi:MAG: septum formation family protein [Microbacterium sp.]
MKKLHMRRALALAGAAGALSLALSGCSVLTGILGGSGDAERDDETGEVTEGSNIDIFALKVGDCKLESASGLISDVDVVPCSEPHDEEVYYEITMDDGEFSEDAIDAASEECIGDAFTNFVGLTYNESTLEVYPLTPTQETWDELNDRVIQCIVSDPAGQTTGSLKGSGI